jgi:hypothetical protein
MNLDKYKEALAEEAFEQLKEIKAYREQRKVRGADDEDLRGRSKLALGVCKTFGQLLATLENRRFNDLNEVRVLGPAGLRGVSRPPQLGSGHGADDDQANA